MHVLHEGVDRLALKLLLHRFVMIDKYLTLNDSNTASNNFRYSTLDALDKPRNVEKADI